LSLQPPSSDILHHEVIIARKQDALELETDGDDGMMHALLTQFPNLTDESPISQQSSGTPHNTTSDPPSPELSEEEEPLESAANTRTSLESSVMRFSHPEDTLIEREESNDDATLVAADSPDSQPPFETILQDISPISDMPRKRADTSFSVGSLTSRNKHSRTPPISLSSLLRMADELYEKFPPLHTSREPEGPSTISSSSSVTSVSDAQAELGEGQEENPPPSLRSSSPTQPTHVQHLRIDDVFGPNSVIFTWSEDPSLMLSDDDAERLVGDGLEDLCNEYDGSSDRDLHEGDYEQEKVVDWTRRRIIESEEDRRRREERRKQMVRSGVGLSVAVLVGLTAVILYGADRSTFGNGSGRHANMLPDWYQTSSWVAGFIVGLGERVLGL
jgi:hypothetical protein